MSSSSQESIFQIIQQQKIIKLSDDNGDQKDYRIQRQQASDLNIKFRGQSYCQQNDSSPQTNFFRGAIIVIIIAFLANISYESYQSASVVKLENYGNFIKCILELQKLDCDLTHLNSKCQKIIECIQNDDEVEIEDILGIIWKEINQNYLPPSIGAFIVLLGQLSENINNFGRKVKKD